MLMKRVLLPLLVILGAATAFAAHPVPELVKDINTRPAPDGAKIQYPTARGDTLFFTACDAAHGQELWKSDGTPRGTKLLKDVLPGLGSSFPRELTVVGNTLFFIADDFQHGFQLWKSDGTPDGTRLVKDLAGDTPALAPKSLKAAGNKLFFLLPGENGLDRLWTSDGTEEGTVEVLPDDASWDSPHDLTIFKDTLVFVREDSVYRTDGTAAGTISLGSIDTSLEPVQYFVGDDILYFVTTDWWWEQSLWKSDGSPGGTTLVTRFDGEFDEGEILGNTLVFSMWASGLGYELWCSDGTSSGTQLLKDLAPDDSSYPEKLTVAGKFIYFTAEPPETGSELWRTDGTEAGTTLVADLNPGAESSIIVELQPVGERLYFSTWDDTGKLWVTDGSARGTRLLKSEPHYHDLGHLVSGENVLFFVASEQLWRTNGAKRGTVQLTGLRDRSGSASSRYSLLYPAGPIQRAGGRVFFSAYDGNRTSLWSSRGTRATTYQVNVGESGDTPIWS
ncbi:MAG TPA: ELWxxDGT repeat protein, partial [Luteolibacter sp.]